nr:hypothetical protein [Pirellula sp.]
MSIQRNGTLAWILEIAIALIVPSSVSLALGQSPSNIEPSATESSTKEPSVEPPVFRPRTDSMAVQDADAVRERLRSLSDSRGPINPLADYGKPKPSKTETKSEIKKEIDGNERDLEAMKAPSLDAEAQRRFPPPRLTVNQASSSSLLLADDGFRPVIGIPVSANYQITDGSFNDPAAMVPPSLGLPSGSVPSFTPPPSGIPLPGAPPIGAPATVLPPPTSNPGSSFGIPAAGIPSAGMPAAGVPQGGIVGNNILPAPPTYIVPTSPSNVFPPTTSTVAPPMSSGQPLSSGPPLSNAPYAPTPTYSREGTTVNSLPFVSPPPQARDARWMVSPEVYRQMASNNACGP